MWVIYNPIVIVAVPVPWVIHVALVIQILIHRDSSTAQILVSMLISRYVPVFLLSSSYSLFFNLAQLTCFFAQTLNTRPRRSRNQ